MPKMHGLKKAHSFHLTEKWYIQTFSVLGKLGLIGQKLLQNHPNSHPILVVTFNLITRFSFYFHGSNVFQLSPSYYVTFSLAKSHCGLILPEFECLHLWKLLTYTLMLGIGSLDPLYLVLAFFILACHLRGSKIQDPIVEFFVTKIKKKIKIQETSKENHSNSELLYRFAEKEVHPKVNQKIVHKNPP